MEAITERKIGDLKPGEDAVIVGKMIKKEKETKKKEPFWLVKISDTTGSCVAMVWNNLEIYPLINGLEDGSYVKAEVHCKQNDNGNVVVEIKSIAIATKDLSPRVDIEALKNELREVIAGMKDVHLRALICNVLRRPDINEAFFKNPATMMTGNSFEGGLLAFVVRNIRLVKAVAGVLNAWENQDNFASRVSEELLIAASILDAVGKCKAFKIGEDGKIEKTLEGELFEDSYLTMKIVNEELDKMEFPYEQRVILEHVLGCSKGRPEHGALHIPRSREAVVFHLVSKLNFEMGQFEYLDRESTATDLFGMLFNKRMYLGCYD